MAMAPQDKGGAVKIDASANKQGMQVPPNVLAYFDVAAVQQPMPLFFLAPESIVGEWTDTSGNKVIVSSTDAYQLRLIATLSRPPRADILLQVWPMPGQFWQCGNAILDPYRSSENELHWVGNNGRVSVWVRVEDVKFPKVETIKEQDPQAVDEAKEEAELGSSGK